VQVHSAICVKFIYIKQCTPNVYKCTLHKQQNSQYKAILKPIWTYTMQLWGTAYTSNTEIRERFQFKVLCITLDAPWYVPNTVIRRDLQTSIVKEEIRHHSSQYSARLSVRSNSPVVNTTTGDCGDTCQTICLPHPKCNCLICS
jgi:hypothetical protein